jgi:hypothetical protein
MNRNGAACDTFVHMHRSFVQAVRGPNTCVPKGTEALHEPAIGVDVSPHELRSPRRMKISLACLLARRAGQRSFSPGCREPVRESDPDPASRTAECRCEHAE